MKNGIIKKTMICLSLSIILIISIYNIASAAFLSYGWPTATVSFSLSVTNTTWRTPMNAAISSWNSAGAKVSFLDQTTSANAAYAIPLATTSYGIMTPLSVSGSVLNKFKIELNTTAISNDAINLSNFTQSVFVHELGHTVWLDDNPTLLPGQTSIMDYFRPRNTMITPQSLDINNVRSKY